MASGHVNRAERPNTWPHRPICTREESSCQLGAVHTWPIATERISMTDRRFRGIAEVARPAACSTGSRLTHGNRRTAPSEKGFSPFLSNTRAVRTESVHLIVPNTEQSRTESAAQLHRGRRRVEAAERLRQRRFERLVGQAAEATTNDCMFNVMQLKNVFWQNKAK